MPEVMIQFTREYEDRDDEEGTLGPFISEVEALVEWERFTKGPGMILRDVQMIDVANPRPIPGWLGVDGVYVEPEDVAPAKPRRWRVRMTRDTTEVAVFEVEAVDESDAERKAYALACAGGGDWSHDGNGTNPYLAGNEDDIEEVEESEGVDTR